MSSSCREAVEFLSSFLSSSRGLGWSRTPTATTAVITKGYHLTRLRRTAGHANPPPARANPDADRTLGPRSAFRRALHPECRRFTTTRPYCLLQYSLTATRCIGELRPMLHAGTLRSGGARAAYPAAQPGAADQRRIEAADARGCCGGASTLHCGSTPLRRCGGRQRHLC